MMQDSSFHNHNNNNMQQHMQQQHHSPKFTRSAGNGISATAKVYGAAPVLPENGTTGVDADLSRCVEVYDHAKDIIYTIPRSDIVAMPQAKVSGAAAARHGAHDARKKLIVCPSFAADGACPNGSRCKHVHAKLDNATSHDVHVNYAWRNADDCSYERFPAGETFRVAVPNESVATEEIPSHLVLKTLALESGRRVMSLCAHFTFCSVCNRGSSCYFVHAVSLAPKKDGRNGAAAAANGGDVRRSWGRTQQPRDVHHHGNSKTNSNNSSDLHRHAAAAAAAVSTAAATAAPAAAVVVAPLSVAPIAEAVAAAAAAVKCASVSGSPSGVGSRKASSNLAAAFLGAHSASAASATATVSPHSVSPAQPPLQHHHLHYGVASSSLTPEHLSSGSGSETASSFGDDCAPVYPVPLLPFAHAAAAAAELRAPYVRKVHNPYSWTRPTALRLVAATA